MFSESLVEGGSKRKEELELSDISDLGLNKVLNLSAIYLLKDTITTNIERLDKMRGIGR